HFTSLTLADYFQKEMKGLFFPLLANNVDNIECVSKQNHCKILNAIALLRFFSLSYVSLSIQGIIQS
ncbi:MAG: hypothetical protein OXC02_06720, partial [Rhodobacteraceae bacterium]|nr:hypothetical protein [Paracoccaceae bacterium]